MSLGLTTKEAAVHPARSVRPSPYQDVALWLQEHATGLNHLEHALIAPAFDGSLLNTAHIIAADFARVSALRVALVNLDERLELPDKSNAAPQPDGSASDAQGGSVSVFHRPEVQSTVQLEAAAAEYRARFDRIVWVGRPLLDGLQGAVLARFAGQVCLLLDAEASTVAQVKRVKEMAAEFSFSIAITVVRQRRRALPRRIEQMFSGT